jgi:tripartite-type tricarboxylate transporter receptor subunit TctC
MSPTSPIRRALLAAAAAALAVAPGLNAQTAWPSKAVRIIVPFSAGSFTETAARAVGAELASQFGQAFIVETRAVPAARWAPTWLPRRRPMATRCS